METKTCTKCGNDRDIGRYRLYKYLKKDGTVTLRRVSVCNVCINKIKYEKLKANPESYERYKERSRKRDKRHREEDPEKARIRGQRYRQKHTNQKTYRDKYLTKRYGIGAGEYYRMLEEQGECCKICGRHKSEFKQHLYVDHNHKTGEVRGLLCHYGNSGIGHFQDNVEYMKKAIEYLS